MANRRIDIDVGLKVDKTGLNQIKSSLQEIKNLTAQDLMRIGGHGNIEKANKDLASLKTSIGKIDDAFKKAFNTDLGTLNVAKFNQALKNMNLNKVYQDFSKAGAAGQSAFRNMTSQILTTNMQLKQTNNFLTNMATTMANTVKWGIASSVMNSFTGSIKKAYGYVKSLDTSLNDIRIVTGASADEMERFAVRANNAAKQLGKSTTEYTNASLIYYQQGLGDEEVAARAETTLKAANVTGQSGQEVSEQLTAVWNGYKVSAEEAELYVDKLAAVAATTASNLEELSVGMSKVASAANLMGVDVDSLTAQISTIIAVTRQAPESVGTALKTIYARMGDIEAGLDGEVSLDHYTQQMADMGVNVLDANGKLRDMGAVIEEIGGKWQTMSREQQLALSQTMAGTRQYNNLLSLFDNWDQYTKALETSRNAAGTLQEQQDTYMESTRAHLNQLKAASEDLYDSLLDPKGINPMIDGLTSITNLFSNFVDSIGGGGNLLLALGSIGTKVFSQQLASGIATFITNLQNAKDNATQLRAELEITQQYSNSNINNSQIKDLVAMKQQVLNLNKAITAEERNVANQYISQKNELYQQQDALKQRVEQAQKLYENLTGTNIPVNTATGKGADQLSKGLAAETLEFQQYIDKVNDTRKSILELTAARQKFDEAKKAGTISDGTVAKDFQPYQKAIDKTKQKIQEYIQVVNSLRDKGKLTPQGVEEVEQAYKKLEAVVGDVNKIQLSNGKHVAALKAYYEETSGSITKTKTAIQSLSASMKTFESDLSSNQKAISQLQQSYTNFLNGIELRAKIQQNLQLVSSFGQLASAMTSIGRLGSIWSNENLSAGEKMLQTVTNLGFALPMLANSLGKILPLEAAIGAARQQQIATLVARNGIEASYNALVQHGVPQQLALDAALAKKNGNTALYNQLLIIQLKLNKGIALSESEQIFLDEALAASKRKVGLASLFAAGGLKAFWGALGLMGQLTVIVVALAAAVKVFDHFHTSAKEAGEALEKSIESFKEAKNELESLESELERTKARMEELLSLDTLTLTEKEELSELQKQNIALEAQIELLKQKVELENRKVARNAKEAATKGTYDDTSDSTPFTMTDSKAESGKSARPETYSSKWKWDSGASGQKTLNTNDFTFQKEQLDSTNQSTFDTWKKEMENLVSIAMEEAAKATEEGNEKAARAWEEVTQKLEADIETTGEEYQAAKDARVDNLEAGYTAAMEALPSLRETNVNGVNDSAIKYYEDITRQYYEASGIWESTITGIADKFLSSEQQADLIKAGEIESEADIKDILGEDSFEKIKEYSEVLGISIVDVVQAFQTMYEDLSGLDFEELQKQLRQDRINNIVETVNAGAGPDSSQLDSDTLNRLYDEGTLTDTHLQNWEALQPYLDAALEKTQDYAEAIRLATEEQAKDLEIQESKQRLAEAAEKYDLDEGELKAYREMLEETAEGAEMTAEALDDAAITNKKMEKGIKTLADKWDDLNKIMSDSESTAEDISSVLTSDVQKALQEILDIDTEQFELLPPDFAQKNWDLIQDAVNGVEGGVEALRNAAQAALGKEVLLEITPKTNMEAFQEEIFNLNNFIANYDTSDFQIGVGLDPVQEAEFYGACQSIVNAAGMTQQEATRYFKNMGYDVEFTNEPQTVSEVVWEKHISTKITKDEDGNVTAKHDTVSGTPKVLMGKVDIPTIKTITPNGSFGGGRSIKNSAPKSARSSGGGGGGGGGGQAKKAKQTERKEKTADRYRGVNNQLSTITTELERLGEAQEHLFGLDLYKNLEKQLELLEKQRDVTAEKLELTKQERAEIAKELQDYGFKFQDGDISNYEAKLESYRAEINKLIDKWNKMSGDQQSGDAGEKLQEQIDKAQEKYDKIEEKIEKWTELQFETIPELVDEMTDMAYKQIELKIEKFNIAVELSLDLQEAFDDWYEFRKKIYGDNIKYSQSSQMALERINQIYDSNTISTLTDKVSTARGELAKIRNGETSEIYTGLDENGNPLKDADGNIISSEQQAIDHIKELTGDLMDSIESVYDLVDEVMDNYISSLEDAEEAMNNYYEAIDQVNDALDHQMTMMELLYGEDAYDKQNQVIQQQLDTTMKGIVESERLLNELPGKIEEQEATIADYEKQLYGSTSNKDYGHGIEGSVHVGGLYEERERLEKELAELQKEEKVEIEADIVGTQEQLDETSKELDDAEESLTIKVNKEELYQQELDSLNGQIAAIERLKANEEEALAISQEMYQMNLEQQREYVEQYTELLIQQYENTIKQASKIFTESLVGAMGMEGAEYEWDNLTREEEKYLDAVNSAYELKSLENKINESINSTDSLSAQKRLNQFKEEELKKLREKDKLTQYDVDRANQLYEIELKRIALEEAQNNKSKMRLRRDASGNYSYQFVADDESIADAQQELDDAINSLYNMDKDQYKQEVEELKDLHQEYEDFRTWYSEQSAEFRAENEEWYKNQCAIYEQQMIDSAKLVEDTKVNLVESANMSMIESVASANQEITTITKDNLDTLVPLVNSAFANMAENINSNPDSFKAQSVEAMNAVFEATETLQAGIDKLSAAVGAKGDGGLYDISSNYYDEAYEGAMKYADAQQKNIDKALQEAEANKALADSLEEVLKNKQLIAGIDEVDKAESDITNSIKEELDKIEEEENKTPEPEPAPSAPAPEPSKPAATKKEDKLTSDRKKGIAAAIIYESNYGGWSVDPTRKDRLKAIFGSKGSEVQSLVNSQVNGKTSEVKKFYDKNKKNMSKYHYSAAQKYDTGGYTGEWNSNDGKWAILHEKELVLNKKDTENLLSIIQIVRDLATMSFNSEEQLPEELKKIYKAMLEKLDDLKSQLFMATNQTSNQLTADTILNGMQNIYTDFLNFSGHEFEQATSLLKDTKESLGTQIRLQNNQNLNLETLGEIQTELFSSLERVLSTDLVTKVQSYIDDFKSKMLEQTEFNTISSIEQFKNISKELSSLGSHMTQDVHINADFPNVTDSYEIQTAIQNLVNSASQHISKSTR